MAGIGTEFGLSVANALTTSANNHGTSVEGLTADLQALIGEMEADVDAQQGESLVAFQRAKAAFVEAYNQMAEKYGLSALAQGATSDDGFTTDDQNVGGYTGAEGNLPGIKPVTIQI
ncbi:hypothetical protein [Glycomyces sp. NPDC048151]|uniref:hypothetical protein n=1 Tax=Glycomyces sp. NPDC048151 TaxID=3364002 RepID=UPI003722B677